MQRIQPEQHEKIKDVIKLFFIAALLFCGCANGSETNDLRQLINSKKEEYRKYCNDLRVKEQIQFEYTESEIIIKAETKLFEYHVKYLNKLNTEIQRLSTASDLDQIGKDIMLKLYTDDLNETVDKINKHKAKIDFNRKKLTVLDAVWKEMFNKNENI